MKTGTILIVVPVFSLFVSCQLSNRKLWIEVMGRISNVADIQIAFVIPLIFHVYILYFALCDYKPERANEIDSHVAVGVFPYATGRKLKA